MRTTYHICGIGPHQLSGIHETLHLVMRASRNGAHDELRKLESAQDWRKGTCYDPSGRNV